MCQIDVYPAGYKPIIMVNLGFVFPVACKKTQSRCDLRGVWVFLLIFFTKSVKRYKAIPNKHVLSFSYKG